MCAIASLTLKEPTTKPFIHTHAIVDSDKIGGGTKIWAFAHIMAGAQIGDNCNICDGVYIESDVIIGDNVVIKNGVMVWAGVCIQDDAFIGPNVVFTNDRYPRSRAIVPEPSFEPTLVKKGGSIGATSSILCGLTIGRYAMVGVGSVVVRDVPDYSLVYGNPASTKGYICECSKKLQFVRHKAECDCGKLYRLYPRHGLSGDDAYYVSRR